MLTAGVADWILTRGAHVAHAAVRWGRFHCRKAVGTLKVTHIVMGQDTAPTKGGRPLVVQAQARLCTTGAQASLCAADSRASVLLRTLGGQGQAVALQGPAPQGCISWPWRCVALWFSDGRSCKAGQPRHPQRHLPGRPRDC